MDEIQADLIKLNIEFVNGKFDMNEETFSESILNILQL